MNKRINVEQLAKVANDAKENMIKSKRR